MEKVTACIRPSTVVLAIVFGAVLSFAVVYGGALALVGYAATDPGLLVAPFGVLSLLFCLLYLGVPLWVNVVRGGMRVPRHAAVGASGAGGVIAPSWTRRSVILHALVMFALWLPVIVALFPGPMNWDTAYQIDQCHSGATVWVIPWEATGSVAQARFSDHHPLFDTLLYGAFALPSEKLFGTWNYGVFAFVMLQAAFTALTFAGAVAYLGRIGAPRKLTAGIYLFFCLVPFYPIYAATMVKDATFAPLFVVYFLMVLECARTRGGFLAENKRAIACFVVVGLLLALTKKPGLHTVIIGGVVLALVYRRAWKAFAAQIGTVALVMLVLLPLVVFPALHVIPGEKQETLGILFQQTARFMVQYPGEVTVDERAAIDRVIALDGIDERYDPTCSDPVKFWYRYDTCTDADLSYYYRVWFEQGTRHPWTYVESVLATAAPYIALDGKLEVHEESIDVNAAAPRVWQPEALAPLRNAVLGTYHWLFDAPAVSLLFRVGVYAYVVPTLALIVLVMRRSRYAPAFVPLVLTFAICIATPMFHARYALPLLYVAPLLVALCFARHPRERSGTKKRPSHRRA